MKKKIFMLLLFLVLISISAVSAGNMDDSNETIVSSESGGEQLSVSNDVDTIDDLNEDDVASDDAVLQNDVKSVDAGEKEILGTETEGDSESAKLGEPVRIIFVIELLLPTTVYDPEHPQFPTFTAKGENMHDETDKILHGNFCVYINGKLKANITPDDKGLFRAELGVLPVGQYTFTADYHDDAGIYQDYHYSHPANPIDIRKADGVIKIDQENIRVEVGDTCPTGATLSPRGGGTLNYTVNDNDVIDVVNDCIIAKKAGSATITVSFGGNENCNPAAGNREIFVTVVQTPTWYVNGSKSSSGDGKSEATAFVTLKEALNVAGNGDRIRIASGTYTGPDNIDLTVGKELNFTKYGDGEVIFDAQGQGRILTVGVEKIIINGFTFKNGKSTDGGAIYFSGNLFHSSMMNVTFINNTASKDGGAIHFHRQTSYNSIVNAAFINNTASKDGGAIHFDSGASYNSIVNSAFINNTAGQNGGVIDYRTDISFNSIKDTAFINNAAGFDGGAIYFLDDPSSNPITNATFINNAASHYGGAIYSHETLFKSNINGKFIANSAIRGGAIYSRDWVKYSDISGTFINNTAEDSGGANYFSKLTNVNIIGDFINNTAKDSGGANMFYNKFLKGSISGIFTGNSAKGSDASEDGGAANYFLDLISEVDIAATFINNTGNNVIYIANASNDNNIHDSVFINNDVKKIVYLGDNMNVTANNNWFGNNVTNFREMPENTGITLENWLFLNATANPPKIDVGEGSAITFRLFSYNGSSIGDYDASKMRVIFDLSQTLGELDKTSASIGEEITYTAKESGDATVTGKFETVSQTVTLTNTVPPKKPTSIEIANSTVDLKVNGQIGSGAALTPADAGNLTYTSSNSSVAVVENGKIKALAVGSANITVSFAGNDKYEASENKTIEVTVALNDASVSVNNVTLDLLVGDEFVVGVITDPEGLDVTFTADDSGVVSVDENSVVTALKEGNATVKVSVGGDGVYALNTTDVKVTVKKIPTGITVANSTVDLKVNDVIAAGAALTPAGEGSLTYTSSNSSVAVVENGKIKALAVGGAIITVSFAGDDKYAASENKTIEVTVALNDASVSVNNVTLDLLVGDEFVVGVITDPEGLDVTFAPDDSGVVSVDENGVVTALKEGSATVKVSVGGDGVYALNTTDVKVTVKKIPTELIVNNATLDMYVGDVAEGVASLKPSTGDNLTYISSNPDVVKVEDGKLVAVANGTAIVTVSYAGNDKYEAADSKVIEVTVSLNDASVSVNKANLDLVVKDTFNLVATTVPEGLNVSYSSTNESVAIVDSNGIVTAVGSGKATIVVTVGDDKVYAVNSTNVTVAVKQATGIAAADVSTTYNINKDLVITLKDTNGKALANVKVTVDLNGAKTYTTDKNGQVRVSTKGLAPKAYTAKVTFNGNANYAKSTKNVKVTVKKATPKLTAKKKTFKTTPKTKKYTIVLKDNTGKAIKKAKVTLKVKGKTYKATTNSKGKAVFKITKLNKKGTFKATITYKGNKYYNKVSKKANIKVIVTFKTVSKGSKDKLTVKEIQQALKDHGYYLSYKGHYLKVDGKFQSCTERSVKQFQKDKGLKVTGKVDEKTAKKLGLI